MKKDYHINQIIKQYNNGEIDDIMAIEELGMDKAKFRRILDKNNKKNLNKKSKNNKNIELYNDLNNL